MSKIPQNERTSFVNDPVLYIFDLHEYLQHSTPDYKNVCVIMLTSKSEQTFFDSSSPARACIETQKKITKNDFEKKKSGDDLSKLSSVTYNLN